MMSIIVRAITTKELVACGGSCGATAPVVWISPAWAAPDSAHARTIANAKRLIVFSFEAEDASTLARKQPSVNTYKTIDIVSRGVANIARWQNTTSDTHRQRLNFGEDSLT
jgi:hypothetical protein